jgi:hypothetical protein
MSEKFQYALIAGLMVMISANAFAEEEPAATPYRPSVSTPATLSEPGWVETELGWQRVSGGDASRHDSIPYTLKLAFSPDWGIRLSGDAWIANTDFDGTSIHGGGDTSAILKRRFKVNDQMAFGLEGGVIAPTAKDELGIGKTGYLINGIYSADIDKYHVDTNLIATRMGDVGPEQGRWQTTWAAALSRAISDKWGVVGEFSGTHQTNVPNTKQFLLAASYNFSKRVVFDIGASCGLTRESQDWSLFTGVTILLGKVF